jgi:hypothetical protein
MKIFGLQAKAIMGPPVALHQLSAMERHDSILYCVQLNTANETIDYAKVED